VSDSEKANPKSDRCALISFRKAELSVLLSGSTTESGWDFNLPTFGAD
jgi:hypothetical protein